MSDNSTRRPTSHIKHFHDGFFGSFLTQVKLNLSPLRAHLFKYYIIDNPFCPSCGDEIETAEHFFLDCKIYIQNIQKNLINLFKLNPSLTLKNKPLIMDFIISGSSCPDKNQLPLITNEIFRHVKIYITTTNRFSDWFLLLFIFELFVNFFLLVNITVFSLIYNILHFWTFHMVGIWI